MPCLPALLAPLLLLLLFHPTTTLSTKAADTNGLRSDVKYIRCETCTNAVKSAVASVNALSEKDLKQLQVLDLIESLCDPSKPSGRWMRKIDLVERVGKLRLVEQEGIQECGRECKTIAMACEDVLDGVETELAERLYVLRRGGNEVKNAIVEEWFCGRGGGISKVCRKMPPTLPRDREPGPAFVEKKKEDVDMEEIMAQMQAAGGGGMNMNMFSRDQMGAMGGASDDDDDEEDEEDESDKSGEDDESDKSGEERSDGSDASSLKNSELGDVGTRSLDGIDKDLSDVGERGAGAADSISDEL